MPDSVNDNVALPAAKNEQTVPLGKEARFLRGQDYNALRDAALSLRTARSVDVAAQAAKDAAQDALILDTRNAQSYQGIGDNTSVLATGSTTPRSLKDWMAALSPPSWDTVPTPWFIAHRGVDWAHPENTFPAFDAAVALGVPVETDIKETGDGHLIHSHDDTVDRTTEGTGSVAAMTLDALLALDAADYFPNYPVTRFATFNEFLGRYARRSLLMLQANTQPATVELAAQVASFGVTPSVLLQSFEPAQLIVARRANPDLKTALLTDAGSPASVATLQSAEAWAAAPAWSDATAEYVAACHAAGIKVIAWTLNKVHEAETLLARGVDGIITDDPAYFSRLVGKVTPSGVVPVPFRFPASGWSNDVVTVETAMNTLARDSGFARPLTAFTGQWYFVAPPVRLPNTSWSLSTTLKVFALDADTTRYIGMRFALTQDRDRVGFLTAGNRGYYVVFKTNGGVEIGRASGTPTPLATATWTALSVGDTIPIQITVTPTTITVRHTGTNATLVATDSTYGRDGFVDVFGAKNTPGLGEVTVTY
jgi:glycerophosphoryl diester phosphodiesterase